MSIVGKEFGVTKLSTEDAEYDFSLPRLDNKVGVGHKDFSVEIRSDLTPKEAARRRDLTINSMGINLVDMTLVDPYNGYQDMIDGVLRATDPASFIEDPLRVMRVMQLLPRKAKTVHSSLIELCASIHGTYEHLASERVFAEFEKLLMKAKKPSIGLEFLRECGWITHFPELNALIGCKQNPEFHPEGDVWVHTLMVVDNGASVRDSIPEEWRLAFMFGLLCHDMGKPVTIAEDLTCHAHDAMGGIEAERFMKRFTREVDLISKVVTIVTNHMRPGQLDAQPECKEGAWRRLHNSIRLDVIGYVSKCDSCGRAGRSMEDTHSPSAKAFTYYEKYGVATIQPIIQGRDLIKAGLKPGADFKQRLALSYEKQLDGEEDYNVLLQIAIG